MRIFGLLGAALVGLTLISGDMALAAAGQPEPWQLGFQDAVTPMMEDITWFHNLLLWVVFGVAGFVLILLLYVMIKFNAKANPKPDQFSHNTFIEVVWTLVPVLILVGIAIPSFQLLYKVDTIPEADITIKATGYQWYWGYQYPDYFDDEEFIANMVPDDELQPGELRLLETDFDIVVPVNKVVKVQTTAADVIHNWAIPSFGVKMDAVPGRLNETWFQATVEGTYYGQCSELCGFRHAFMPITVKVVSEREFNAWVAQQKSELGLADAAADDADAQLALAQ